MLSKKEIQKNRKILTATDESMADIFKVLGDVNRYRIFASLLNNQNSL